MLYSDKTKKYGLDKLNVMIHFIEVLDARGASYDRFKSYIVSQIKRGITAEEEKRLLEQILAYVQSEVVSNARTEAMDKLFDLDFLDEPESKKATMEEESQIPKSQ